MVKIISEQFLELSSIMEYFGYKMLYLKKGKEIMLDTINNMKHTKETRIKEPVNKYEKKILKIFRKYTNSYLSNIEIVYIEPYENFEYDIIYASSNQILYLIELMDYSKAKKDIKKISELTEKFKETMKSKVIFSVIDKSLRLTPFMRIIILLKGFPVKEYNELKKFANSRGVLILNDHDIENKIEALISYSISELVLEKQIHFEDYLKNYNNYKSALNNLINQ